jgi:hypothetical protein
VKRERRKHRDTKDAKVTQRNIREQEFEKVGPKMVSPPNEPQNSLPESEVAPDNAEVNSGGAAVISANGNIDVTSGGSFVMTAGNDISVNSGGGWALIAGNDLSIQEGGGMVMVAGNKATVRQGFIGLLLTPKADLSENSQVLLTVPQAAALGAALGLVLALLGRLLRRGK